MVIAVSCIATNQQRPHQKFRTTLMEWKRSLPHDSSFRACHVSSGVGAWKSDRVPNTFFCVFPLRCRVHFPFRAWYMRLWGLPYQLRGLPNRLRGLVHHRFIDERWRLDAQNEFEVFWVLSMCHTHSHTSTMFFQNGKHVKIYSSPYTKYSEHVSTWSSQWSFTWKKDHHHWFIIENLNTSTDLPWTRIWIPIVIFNELEYKVFISRY